GYSENLPEWNYELFLKHVVPEQVEDVKRQFQSCYETEADWTLECEILRTDGARRWLFARGQPVRDHHGQANRMYGTISDITDRKQAERSLADSAAHVRRIIDNMLGFVGVLDTDGRLLDANGAALKTANISLDMVQGKYFWDCYWWEYDSWESNRLRNAVQRARTGESVRYDARVQMAGGQIIDIDFMLVPAYDDQGVITHLIPSGIDITERKVVERALRDSESFTRSVLENMAQFAWMADETGALFWYNQRWYDYTGTTLEQMRGWGWQAVQHPDFVDDVTAKFKHAIDHGIEWEDTFPLRGRDGEYRWFLSRAMPIRNADGQVIRWFGTNTDISERIRIEGELERARLQAEAANQAKSDFLANMSHEIRTPMTAILGFADLLNATDEDQREKVETIRRNGQFLLELINDILDLSKIEAGKIEIDVLRFSPRKLIEDVCSLMNVRAVESNLELKVEFQGPIPDVIENDPIRVRQILINLVGNAIKFTHEGCICLRLSYSPQRRMLNFDVIDSGIGISAELQAKLFRPFEQGDSSIVRRYGGSGLGLAISQRLAHVLGGQIEVSSRVGQGSTFTLSISIGEVPDMRLLEVEATGNCWTSHDIAKEYGDNYLGRATATSDVGSGQLNVRVLVVDDRRDIRFLTQHFVRQIGGEVLLAENGKQALAIADQERLAGRGLDIILMDVQMPEMDGITATKHLRGTNYTGPIIALTANAMDSDRQACLSAGYTDYLSKPIDATQLIDMLRRYSKSASLPSHD
ncbi:MAG: PAS domain S-box protein, partial [Pirellulaceae bacterium]|nr:PAS domain S-box protein [Pirellulaceae bacterium]